MDQLQRLFSTERCRLTIAAGRINRTEARSWSPTFVSFSWVKPRKPHSRLFMFRQMLERATSHIHSRSVTTWCNWEMPSFNPYRIVSFGSENWTNELREKRSDSPAGRNSVTFTHLLLIPDSRHTVRCGRYRHQTLHLSGNDTSLK